MQDAIIAGEIATKRTEVAHKAAWSPAETSSKAKTLVDM
eukprot:SAG31_NODE_10356_length_1149_cov_1.262857_2_plen_38_part_01